MKKILIILLLISNTALASIDEVEFQQIPKNVLEVMTSEISDSGLSISLNLNWESNTTNAGANRSDNTGVINLYGGYARLNVVTKESFALTICHELGHLISKGYKVMPTLKYAAESEADYFATSICLRKYFQKFPTNRIATDWQRDKCKETSPSTLSLCTDLLIASRDTLKVDQELTPREKWEDYTKLDTTQTERTLFNDYSKVSCRYTSYVHGALSLSRPSCWLHPDSKISRDVYELDYEYPEAMFVGEVKSLENTNFGCRFKIKNVSYFNESRLFPLDMNDISGEFINVFGKCRLLEGEEASGTISKYKSNLYYNLESRDK
ncbi:hypothetical protein [Halobacteriovorax sp. JY17]|uniref:ImmA/IrrE family metallo-endopeptidase n=1 Tax=Halobacteriovorax sp. JY17 TaxID=2014617 RepID=UPI000C66B23F|nr:hypothetical protein [Halobacteriovorax sp. JY17]PIK16139.1 MAG: hypothetical protein CES88_05240 [Halobacteriovorax sp. JY17]